jgi:hypothetical protein
MSDSDDTGEMGNIDFHQPVIDAGSFGADDCAKIDHLQGCTVCKASVILLMTGLLADSTQDERSLEQICPYISASSGLRYVGDRV